MAQLTRRDQTKIPAAAALKEQNGPQVQNGFNNRKRISGMVPSFFLLSRSPPRKTETQSEAPKSKPRDIDGMTPSFLPMNRTKFENSSTDDTVTTVDENKINLNLSSDRSSETLNRSQIMRMIESRENVGDDERHQDIFASQVWGFTENDAEPELPETGSFDEAIRETITITVEPILRRSARIKAMTNNKPEETITKKPNGKKRVIDPTVRQDKKYALELFSKPKKGKAKMKWKKGNKILENASQDSDLSQESQLLEVTLVTEQIESLELKPEKPDPLSNEMQLLRVSEVRRSPAKLHSPNATFTISSETLNKSGQDVDPLEGNNSMFKHLIIQLGLESQNQQYASFERN